jgi:hypothetical protein
MIRAELLAALKQLDEVTLIEILDLRSDQIVDQFEWLIEDRFDEISNKVDDPREYEIEASKREELTGKLSWKTSDTQTFFDNDSDD